MTRAAKGPEGAEPAPQGPALRRRLSLTLLTLYGLGTTIGAGIFVLVGKVAGEAGGAAPLSFVIASLLAAPTALAFAELAARFPKSAGEAVYVHEGLRLAGLPLVVGLLVATAGTVSASAISGGFYGYLEHFVDLPRWLAVGGLVVVLGLLAAWGIAESVSAAAVITLVEAGALVFVAWSARDSLGELPARWDELLPAAQGGTWLGVAGGAVLAFYAFIGFEDMVNVAEEVRDVEHTMPRAIVLTLALTTLLYLLVVTAAVLAVPLDELAASNAPLALVYERASGLPPDAVSAIAIFAVLNGALVQVIMASRVLYGLASQRWLPRVLARVNAATHTPLVATALVTGIVLILAVTLPVVRLAEVTSLATLCIFALVNLALWRLKRRGALAPAAFVLPPWVPLAGFAVSAVFALFQLGRFLGI